MVANHPPVYLYLGVCIVIGAAALSLLPLIYLDSICRVNNGELIGISWDR